MEEKLERKPKSILKKTENRRKQRLAAANEEDEEDSDEAEEEDSDIALSDLEDLPEEEREDLFVKTKLSINNQPALLAAVKRISIPKDASTSFATHQTVVSSEPTEPKIEDISDDLQRELQLYAQSLEAAKQARALLRAEGLPFSRPKDYFAEMVKDDGHMEKVKAKLVEEATAKKASAEARKQRDLKKFGKQVQVAKLQERQKEKRETLEKIKALKKSMLPPPLPNGCTHIPPPPPRHRDRITASKADICVHKKQSAPRTAAAASTPTRRTSSTSASTTSSTSPASGAATASRAAGPRTTSGPGRTPSSGSAARSGTPSPAPPRAPAT